MVLEIIREPILQFPRLFARKFPDLGFDGFKLAHNPILRGGGPIVKSPSRWAESLTCADQRRRKGITKNPLASTFIFLCVIPVTFPVANAFAKMNRRLAIHSLCVLCFRFFCRASLLSLLVPSPSL